MTDFSAISVKNITKSYGSKIILNELSMDVERGTIYGLLGASGCGKTTLLSCIVGRKSINAGEIFVLGGRPGEKGSGVPGPKIGYMPQELALVEELTIEDAIFYFGTIFKMKSADIRERLEQLSVLLELPPSNTILKDCSGGQKRRVSFAVALVHSPGLLILDEPTVGIDPVLREKLWDHLKNIVNTNRTTVIITTHYIEETRQADKIGLMREGKLLTEESPTKLLSMYQKDTLEEVFLLLSQKQNMHKSNPIDNSLVEKNGNSLETISTSNSVESFVMGYGSRDELTKFSTKRKTKNEKSVYMSATDLDIDRIKALLSKNWKQFYRNTGGVFLLITFPVIQMLVFIASIGSDPRHLNLGIVNSENMIARCPDFNWNETAMYFDYECHFRNLPCRFLTYLEDPMINKVLYDSLPEAVDAVKHGEVLGVLYIPRNFTENFEERVLLGPRSSQWLIDNGEIKVYMDMSNRQTGSALALKVYNRFIEFQEELYADCRLPEKLVGVPIHKTFIHGDNGKPISIFVAPGMILTLIYLLGSTMTSQTIIREKTEGTWDRSIVAGVSSLEITCSHLLLQSLIIFIESIELLIMVNLVPKLEITGSLWIIFLLTYFQGVCGMSYGFLVSTVCNKCSDATLLSNGSFLPMTLISGIVWPIEAMPKMLKWLSMATPCTVPILSFRNVMAKGWNLLHLEVINGLGILLGWTLIFGIGSVWVIKIRR